MNRFVKAELGVISMVTVWQHSIFSGCERRDVEHSPLQAGQAIRRSPESKPSELVKPVELKKVHSSSDTERSGYRSQLGDKVWRELLMACGGLKSNQAGGAV